MKKFLLAAASCAALATAAPAAAATVLFNFVGTDPADSFSFSIDDSPVPDATFPGSFEFDSFDITTSTGDDIGTLVFFDLLNGGGLDFLTGIGGGFSFGGPQLYTGGEANPVFQPGTFILSSNGLGVGPGGTPAGTLTISSVATGAVPEPGTWMLMILGFGAMGAAMRRKTAPAKVAVSYS